MSTVTATTAMGERCFGELWPLKPCCVRNVRYEARLTRLCGTATTPKIMIGQGERVEAIHCMQWRLGGSRQQSERVRLRLALLIITSSTLPHRNLHSLSLFTRFTLPSPSLTHHPQALCQARLRSHRAPFPFPSLPCIGLGFWSQFPTSPRFVLTLPHTHPSRPSTLSRHSTAWPRASPCLISSCFPLVRVPSHLCSDQLASSSFSLPIIVEAVSASASATATITTS